MLVPDNVHPDQTIYFYGAFVLKAITQWREADLIDLYIQSSREQPMSMPIFILCLDWLYLLDLITLNLHGKVKLCS